MHARIISKGTDAEIAAAAATHGLAVILKPVVATTSRFEQRHGIAYAYPEGSDHHLHTRLCQWFTADSAAEPGNGFPAGTLLWFQISDSSLPSEAR